MLTLIDMHTKVFDTHLDVRSLTFEDKGRQFSYYGKHIVIARWSIEHDRSDKPATDPRWDIFAQVLLAS